MDVIKEIKAGQTGYGLLIENDGYISMDKGKNKSLYESFKTHDGENGEFYCPDPFIVSAVFQKYGIKNANGRIYPEEVLKPEVEAYQQKIKERRAYGECNHPDSASIDLGRIAMNIIELHWEGHTLVGEMEIIVSEGFRRTGICSTFGDQIANLLLKGLKIGVSSRGLGSVEQKFGTTIVTEYQLVCWDVVSDPSTPNAWIGRDKEELTPYLEQKEEKNEVIETLKKFDNWLS